MPKKGRFNGKSLTAPALTLVCLYLVVLAALAAVQDRLIFHPQKITADYAMDIADNPNVEEVVIQTQGGVALHGWLVNHSGLGKTPLIIYYGGNGEEVSGLIGQAGRLAGYALLLMNYRGYGLSQGIPNERNICGDAELIYDELMKREDIDPDRLIVMGRSIGSGVAVHIAQTKKTAGVILVTPYDSLVNVVQKKVRFIPAALLLRSRFDSVSKAPQLTLPMLTLIAGRDEVIPKDHALRLVRQWGGPAEAVIIENTGHNDIQLSPRYWESIGEFLLSIY